MKLFLRIFQYIFGCGHRYLSRLFTIKRRTYKARFYCGREFDLPDPFGARATDASPAARLRTNGRILIVHAEAPVLVMASTGIIHLPRRHGSL